ncbi:hypothetical protein [Fuscibacter oryzae]|uniref:Uncharacterized protein n=1 Tax=Fuscibacter oryzae TaxID=2803939 RepID=A0A8J7MU64_9RHOB|nr:hypothetical protein [Fuscibacter oryzae]MBL4929080.1 hypothetical protein [Fuscibacter oryzae]
MKGLELFLHSVRQVTGNLDGALRVSALPILIQTVVVLLFMGGAMMGMGGPGAMAGGGMGMGAGMGLGMLIVMVVAVVTSLWLAVAWHRYVLLNEQPQGFVPPYNGERMMGYFGRSLGYGLIVVIAGAVLGTIIGSLLSPLLSGGGVVVFLILMAVLVQLPMIYLAFRLTTALPGSAVGSGLPFMAGWEATKGASADILVLSAIAVGAHLVLAVLGFLIFDRIPVVSILWNVAVTWLVTMVGVSILTTLYGHYIEKRPLV